ncbi:flightin [Cydia strobilella]|uniref:flightin n=1 Tax=Cydia strobilella TaxID=1100964 RepID=UPI003006DC24
MWDDADIEESAAPEPPPEEAPAEAAEEPKAEEAEPPAPEPVVVTEPKKLIFKHWVRPKFLQYNYMYDYRHNYYDDVINYLDRRNKGMATEKPRAQTWGERALRTYIAKDASYRARQASRDTALLRAVSTGARFHRYHTKSIISRKYSTLGFNTVSI